MPRGVANLLEGSMKRVTNQEAHNRPPNEYTNAYGTEGVNLPVQSIGSSEITE